MSFDAIPHGPPPLVDEGPAFGARATRVDGRFGIRLLFKGWQLTVDDAGEAVAFVEVTIPSAVQAVQALRQAIGDARKGLLR